MTKSRVFIVYALPLANKQEDYSLRAAITERHLVMIEQTFSKPFTAALLPAEIIVNMLSDSH